MPSALLVPAPYPAGSPRRRIRVASLLATVGLGGALAAACGRDSPVAPVEATPAADIVVHDLRGLRVSSIGVDGSVVHAAFTRGHSPLWFPDGKRVLVFLFPESSMGWEGTQLAIATPDGGLQRLVDSPGPRNQQNSAFVAPTGDWVYFNGVSGAETGIWRVRSDRTGLELLVPRPNGTPQLTVRGASADNQRLLVQEYTDTKLPHLAIYDVPAKLLTRLPVQGYFARWSPDGRFIAYIDTYAGTVSVAGADGSAPRVVFHREPLRVIPATESLRGLTWSPDGREILVGIQNRGLERIDVASGTSVRVPGSENFVEPDWLRR